MSFVVRMPAGAEFAVVIVYHLGNAEEIHVLHPTRADSIPDIVGSEVVTFARDAEYRMVFAVIGLDFSEQCVIIRPESSQRRLPAA